MGRLGDRAGRHGEVSDVWRRRGVGDNGNGRQADCLRDTLEARRRNLEDTGAAEPGGGWSDGAVNGARDAGEGAPERVNENWEEGIVHVAQEAQGDVPMLWPHRLEAWR